MQSVQPSTPRLLRDLCAVPTTGVGTLLITTKNYFKASEQDTIDQSNNLLLLFAEIISSCPDCLQRLRDSKKVNTS